MYRIGGCGSRLPGFVAPVAIGGLGGLERRRGRACVAWAAALVVHFADQGGFRAGRLVKLAPFVAPPASRCEHEAGPGSRSARPPRSDGGGGRLLLALSGLDGLGDMAEAISFQAERGSLLSVWALTGADAAQVVVQAAVATLVVMGAAQIWRDGACARPAAGRRACRGSAPGYSARCELLDLRVPALGVSADRAGAADRRLRALGPGTGASAWRRAREARRTLLHEGSTGLTEVVRRDQRLLIETSCSRLAASVGLATPSSTCLASLAASGAAASSSSTSDCVAASSSAAGLSGSPRRFGNTSRPHRSYARS